MKVSMTSTGIQGAPRRAVIARLEIDRLDRLERARGCLEARIGPGLLAGHGELGSHRARKCFVGGDPVVEMGRAANRVEIDIVREISECLGLGDA